jgi:light-regulated signal transduction histidine kinase (bacteriophytochrome)
VEIAIGSMPAAQGDPEHLREVWEALVDNALKFTRRTAAARIEIGHEPETGAWFVRDNGAGFDTERAGRLFMLFQRLHSADDYPGGGVGLALARRIVERHGGRMWAEARPDEGATFRFTLPD